MQTLKKPLGSAQNRKTKKSVEYYTPGWLVTAARETLGTIDIDPASCWEANAIVRACRFYTSKDDGLSKPWCYFSTPSNVFLNYPSDAKLWWTKLLAERAAGHIIHAIVVAYSADPIFATQSGCGMAMADFPICLLRKRVPYLVTTEDGNLRAKSGTPCHSAVVYVPGIVNLTDRFYAAFRQYGQIVTPYQPTPDNIR